MDPSSTPPGAMAKIGRRMSSSSSSSSSSTSTGTFTSGDTIRPNSRNTSTDTFHNLFYVSPVSTAPSRSSRRTSDFPMPPYSPYSSYSCTTPTQAPVRRNMSRPSTDLIASPNPSPSLTPVPAPRARREKGKGTATILHNPDAEMNRSSRASTFAADRRARADLCARLRTDWDAGGGANSGAGMGSDGDGGRSSSAVAVENERVRGNFMWEMVHEGI